jgi:hypothetical protein
MSPQIVGIKDLPVPKTETRETENLDKTIPFDLKVQVYGHSH